MIVQSDERFINLSRTDSHFYSLSRMVVGFIEMNMDMRSLYDLLISNENPYICSVPTDLFELTDLFIKLIAAKLPKLLQLHTEETNHKKVLISLHISIVEATPAESISFSSDEEEDENNNPLFIRQRRRRKLCIRRSTRFAMSLLRGYVLVYGPHRMPCILRSLLVFFRDISPF